MREDKQKGLGISSKLLKYIGVFRGIGVLVDCLQDHGNSFAERKQEKLHYFARVLVREAGGEVGGKKAVIGAKKN